MKELLPAIAKEDNQEKIEVKLSYKIIELFSEGLYSSPNKAIEELVSNSFDASATKVHILMPEDRSKENPNAYIAVIDNGIGMDKDGLTDHWTIGKSNKRSSEYKNELSRKQIGKFGIGKLATYVLANHLTHLTKKNSEYFLTSMNYESIDKEKDQGVFSNESMEIPLRKISEAEARKIASPFLKGKKKGYTELKLFGDEAEASWTMAIMHGLKDMASEIKTGRLKWVLSTALPLRDDFHLFFNGDAIQPSKLGKVPIKRWTLGKDYLKENIKKPSLIENYQNSIDETLEDKDPLKYGIRHENLDRITGYFEIYEDKLTTGKSEDNSRSNGFFVYVHGRLININDGHFGIDANQLRHGTFSRFRAVLYMDKLDEALRSSRENVREGVLFQTAKDLLKTIFNHASASLQKHNEDNDPSTATANRVSQSPASLAHIPLVNALQSVFKDGYEPLYIDTTGINLNDKYIKELSATLSEESFLSKVEYEEIGQDELIAKYHLNDRCLKINRLHPFIAYFHQDFDHSTIPLELISMLEVLTETYLLQDGISSNQIGIIMKKRDNALKHFAKSLGKKSAFIVAQDLVDSDTDQNKLEQMLVESFNMLGFDAVPLGGPNRPDGTATAKLPATPKGVQQRYKVNLEAKSKKIKEGVVSSKNVGTSTILRHMKDNNCDHAIVVGPNFPEGKEQDSAIITEINEAIDVYTKAEGVPRTITLVRTVDLAKLVRIAPLRGVGIDKIRDLFMNCVSPTQSKAWIDALENEPIKERPYKEILEIIYEFQDNRSFESVEYSSIAVTLEHKHKITMQKNEVRVICEYLARIATGLIFAGENHVELRSKPEHIIEKCKNEIRQYPEGEQSSIFSKELESKESEK